MNEPWRDLIRMQPGVFRCIGGVLKVELIKFEAPGKAQVSIGNGNGCFGVQPATASVLSAFFAALAIELKKQTEDQQL